MSITPRVAMLSLVFAVLSFAQDSRTATLVGTVTDPSGAPVPSATISATAVQTQVTSHGQTTTEGTYYVPFLSIGAYELTVEASGFKKLVRSGIVMEAGVTTRIDVALEVGAL